MKKTTLIAIIIAIIFASGIAGAVLSTTYSEPLTHPFMRGQRIDDTVNRTFEDRDLQKAREGFEIYLPLKAAITCVNIALSVILLAIYVSLYRQIKTEFTIGLIVVTFSLLVYAVTSNPLIHMLFGFRWFGMGPFIMIPDIFATLALAVLLYISLK
jgi:hypothetical protein